MVKISEKNTTIPPVDSHSAGRGERVVAWAGHLIRVLKKKFKVIYTSIFNCATYHYINQLEKKVLPKTHHVFKKSKADVQLTRKSEMAEQIQKAKNFHQQELAALDYIRRLSMVGTIALMRSNFNSITSFLKPLCDQDPLLSEALNVFLVKAQELDDFLNQEKTILGVPTSVQEELVFMPSEKVTERIADVFARARDLYTYLKPIGSSLTKGTPERKQFVKLCKIVVQQMQKQHSIYKIPSSDPYLYNLQHNERKARESLQVLKQQQMD